MAKITNFKDQPNLPQLEEEVLKFWQADHTFEKSIENRDTKNSYVFYDGPPFATGTPHYGHIVASTMKDIVPRYWTMKGKRVERKWGWDCHGLPIENIAEKEMGIKQKKEIEALGVDKFNEICRSKVLSYVDQWEVLINRLGRWADMKNAYKTMDLSFMESVWWVFKQLWDNGLIYQSHRSMHICPRCETTLSQSEVAEGYKDITDISVMVEFKLLDPSKLIDTSDQVFVLAWTTTPWTLPGNFLLAINPEQDYVLFSASEVGKMYIAMQERMTEVAKEGEYKVVKQFKGSQLVGLSYQPLFPYFADTKNAFRVVAGDFVTGEDGTGVVHIAPGFGQDDYNLGKLENVKLIQHVGYNGRFTDQVTDFVGLEVKPKDHHQDTDIEIIKYLAKNDQLWSKKKIVHSYPHCWRCETPLLNYATSSWFVNVSKIKPEMLKNAKNINWIPEHIKEGRFGNWLEGAKDWSISRQRFWASVMPIWQCQCGEQKVYGDVKELEKDSGQTITDLHKHIVDKLVVDCPKCGQKMQRVPDVIDTWFDSGSMPYAQAHYPFENKNWFESNFPAEFIAEGVDQTRAWFYYLHVIASGIKQSHAFKNVIVNGIVLAQDGKKMSKRLLNYPDPALIVNQYGADSLRVYLASSPVMKAENLNFMEKEVADVRRKVFLIWWNVFSFYKQFADQEVGVEKPALIPENILDRWLVDGVEQLTLDVSQALDDYDLVKASRMLMDFVDVLSTWYLRLSRERIKAEDNQQVSQVLGFAIYRLAVLFAPFAPFFAEVIHHNLIDDQTSIHLTDWPALVDKKTIDSNLVKQMFLVKQIVEAGRTQRAQASMKLRQPLQSLTVNSNEDRITEELVTLISQEVNVKTVIWQKAEIFSVSLDFKLTSQLEREGQAREVIRTIQDLRKQLKLNQAQLVNVILPSWPEEWSEEIKSRTNAKELIMGETVSLTLVD